MYSFKSRVRFSEVDAKQNLTLYSILNYFQDCSIFHSEYIQAGIDHLTSEGHAWILSSWQVIADHCPSLGDEIEVSTWAYGFRGFYGYRNFKIEDQEGRIAACANTIWTFMDLNTKSPVRIPKHIQDAYGFEPQLPMENAPRKIRLPQNGIPCKPLTVHKFQIDTNHHMNNAQYVLMAQEYLPEQSIITQMRADYRKSAVLNDMIYPVVTHTNLQTTVALNDSDGSPYAIIEFNRR
ncbi:Acyl-ACP thioesterase [uncultured Roseburia sp.]|uniref:Thioesterase n=1 Tax=Brotonthovivens ammoniilytica TaxID=2981725 RepID=A0ABT2TM01_9FIRM|nr:acyl-ACP thioesterase domain-containing protein [Brotonthovivens ammoniilytica]MCU6763252.1 thioesterase [Brotonthovivens ammoniilytica]SCJ10882.1 Acyl-ACP thioesterase [uncultured Roseburia sp.]